MVSHFHAVPAAAAQPAMADPMTKLRRVSMCESRESRLVIEPPESKVDRILWKASQRSFGSVERNSLTKWMKAAGMSASSRAGDGLADRPYEPTLARSPI